LTLFTTNIDGMEKYAIDSEVTLVLGVIDK
jgi:hypothetical protein